MLHEQLAYTLLHNLSALGPVTNLLHTAAYTLSSVTTDFPPCCILYSFLEVSILLLQILLLARPGCSVQLKFSVILKQSDRQTPRVIENWRISVYYTQEHFNQGQLYFFFLTQVQKFMYQRHMQVSVKKPFVLWHFHWDHEVQKKSDLIEIDISPVCEEFV